MENVNVYEVTSEDIDKHNESLVLNSVFDKAEQITGITHMHFLADVNGGIVALLLSKDKQPSRKNMPTGDALHDVTSQ